MALSFETQNAIKLQRVQNNFLKYASYVLRIECPPHNYLPILEYLKLDSLKFIDKLLKAKRVE